MHFREDVNASLTFRDGKRTAINVAITLRDWLQFPRILNERLHLVRTFHRTEASQNSLDHLRNAFVRPSLFGSQSYFELPTIDAIFASSQPLVEQTTAGVPNDIGIAVACTNVATSVVLSGDATRRDTTLMLIE